MDMAICFVLFNPANSKRMLMNYHYVVNEFKLQKFPIFTLELLYSGRTPQIADAIHVKSNSIMFHKENMCRVLEKYIPPKFTKLTFLDADLVFKDKEWYSKTSKLLDTYDVVQPFETCNWLDLTYKNILETKRSFAFITTSTINWDFHPGFVWCFKRDWYNKFGFFDKAISGGGDLLSSIGWLKLKHEKLTHLTYKLGDIYNEFFTSCPKPKVTYLKGSTIFHLYHGSKRNRKYVERTKKILANYPSVSSMLVTNSNGIYEWNDTHRHTLNKRFLQYFEEREDDDLSP